MAHYFNIALGSIKNWLISFWRTCRREVIRASTERDVKKATKARGKHTRAKVSRNVVTLLLHSSSRLAYRAPLDWPAFAADKIGLVDPARYEISLLAVLLLLLLLWIFDTIRLSKYRVVEKLRLVRLSFCYLKYNVKFAIDFFFFRFPRHSLEQSVHKRTMALDELWSI